jgi:hypothetical protein
MPSTLLVLFVFWSITYLFIIGQCGSSSSSSSSANNNKPCTECAAVPECDPATQTCSKDERDKYVRKGTGIVYGRIQYEGTIISGKGFRVEAQKDGVFVITYDTIFKSPPTVLLEPTPAKPVHSSVTLQKSTVTSATIACFSGGRRSPSPTTFAFVAVGERDSSDVAVVRGQVDSEGEAIAGKGFRVQVFAPGHYFLIYEPNPWAGGHPTVFAHPTQPNASFAGFDSGCPSGHKSEIKTSDFASKPKPAPFHFITYGAHRYGVAPAEDLNTVAGELSARGTVLRGDGFTVAVGDANGMYTLQFSIPFSDVPTLYVQPKEGYIHPSIATAYIVKCDTDSVVVITEVSGVQSAMGFRFVAVGP